MKKSRLLGATGLFAGIILTTTVNAQTIRYIYEGIADNVNQNPLFVPLKDISLGDTITIDGTYEETGGYILDVLNTTLYVNGVVFFQLTPTTNVQITHKTDFRGVTDVFNLHHPDTEDGGTVGTVYSIEHFDTTAAFSYSWNDGAGSWFQAAGNNNLIHSSVVPIPASIWLFGSGLLGLIGIARRMIAT